MSELFRLAVAAAAGYAVQYQAAKVESKSADGSVTRLSSMGRLIVGAGVALAVWFVFPSLVGERSRLAGSPKGLLGTGDCGCDL